MARARKQVEEDNPLRWLTTYGDVVTLLLAFFVMLYAISQVDQQKFLLFVSGLEDPFGNPSVAEGLLEDGTGIVGASFTDEGEGGEDGIRGIALLDGMPELDEAQNENEKELEASGVAELATASDLAEVRDAIESALVDSGLGDVVDYTIDTRGLVIGIATDGVLFPSGSASFDAAGREIIDVIAPTFHEFSNEVLVEGHTDNVPILNRAGYDNWDLSADRALAVLKHLVEHHGLRPDRLSATGFGEYQPITSNDTDEGKSINRRVELVIVAEIGASNGS
jgi:chemotaxis protein MotB